MQQIFDKGVILFFCSQGVPLQWQWISPKVHDLPGPATPVRRRTSKNKCCMYFACFLLFVIIVVVLAALALKRSNAI